MKGKGTPIRPTHPRTVKTLQQQKEKKPEVPTAGVPKIAKPPTKRPEIFELQKSLPTSLETFSDLVGAFNNGTDELRRLLDFECEFIFECRVCRNLFRSLSNFIQHKRAYCFDRFKELKRKFDFNGEVVDKVVQLNGSSPKGAVVSTRKTMRKDIYEVLKKVGNFTEEISPAEHLYTKNIEKTEAALHTFFHQEGKAPTEERSATLGPDGTIISSHPFPLTEKGTATEPHPALRPATSTTGGQSERRTDVNSLKCINCNATFGSVSELNLHSSSRACSQLRCYYTCPICQKAVHSPYSVYRHLRRVHSKSLDQIQKLRDKIRKKFMKDPRPWKNKNRSTSPAAEVKSSAPSPNTAKRTHLTESSSPVKTIVEVRHYNKSPIRPELSLPALMRKQPLVVLTKTAIPHSMTSFSLTNASDPAASTDESNPSTSLLQNDTSDSRSQSDSPSQPKLLQPPKRARVEKDLSWLKRGPTAPVVEGARLTRTARALYGSPKKSLSNGELPEKMTIADENEVSENGGKTESPCRSNDNMADHRGASISDDTDGEDPKGDDDGESLDSAFINKRLSSSEDNVQMMASSSRMCNVSPTKAEGEKMDVNDRGSTSGIETDLSPEVDQVTPSQSDDESEDVDRLVNIYQTSPPPTKMSLCNRPSSADRVSDSGSFGSVEDNGTTSDERSCIVRLKNSKITKAPTSAPDSPSRRDHIKPIYVNSVRVTGRKTRMLTVAALWSARSGRLRSSDVLKKKIKRIPKNAQKNAKQTTPSATT